jgi:proteasome lid subunit RPN8/RPN11
MADTNKLRIGEDLVEKIRRHGAETYPYECCGALLGRDAISDGSMTSPREISGLFPLVNRTVGSSHNRFSVTPLDVLNAEKVARAGGWDVIGWYHSHPDHPARPSEYDREHAWPWYSYVIVSVQEGVPLKMTSWRLKDDRTEYTEETIEVRSEAVVKSGV